MFAKTFSSQHALLVDPILTTASLLPAPAPPRHPLFPSHSPRKPRRPVLQFLTLLTMIKVPQDSVNNSEDVSHVDSRPRPNNPKVQEQQNLATSPNHTVHHNNSVQSLLQETQLPYQNVWIERSLLESTK
jgi:hypothetical protein